LSTTVATVFASISDRPRDPAGSGRLPHETTADAVFFGPTAVTPLALRGGWFDFKDSNGKYETA
jgi:hypothetical protein